MGAFGFVDVLAPERIPLRFNDGFLGLRVFGHSTLNEVVRDGRDERPVVVTCSERARDRTCRLSNAGAFPLTADQGQLRWRPGQKREQAMAAGVFAGLAFITLLAAPTIVIFLSATIGVPLT